MPDYSKSKIYKIVCNITGETYYGSTTQALNVRIGGHRNETKRGVNRTTSRQIIERGDYDIVLCEECPCETKEQLHAIERKWIETNDCVNKTIPTRTIAEWYEANAQRMIEYHKNYYETNKDTISEKAKVRRSIPEFKQKKAIADKEYREAHLEELKAKKKIYNQEHREEQAQRAKKYREENAETLKAKKALYREAHKEELAFKERERQRKKREEKHFNSN